MWTVDLSELSSKTNFIQLRTTYVSTATVFVAENNGRLVGFNIKYVEYNLYRSPVDRLVERNLLHVEF